MKTPKIALIHATPLAMKPVAEVFARLWPAAQCRNMLDDGLTTDLQAAGGINAAMEARFVSLAKYAEQHGADGILFTCSAFGSAIEKAAKTVSLPTLKPNEAMFDEALNLCAMLGGARSEKRRIGLVTTFTPATAPMLQELNAAIMARGLFVEAHTACAEGSMALLAAGDTAQHDALIVQATRLMPPCDVYVMGQFSMARAQDLVREAMGKPVLSSPVSAVKRLQAMIHSN